MEEKMICALALGKVFMYKCNVGKQLIRCCGGVESVFGMKESDLGKIIPEESGFLTKILDKGLMKWAEDEYKWAMDYGIRLFFCEDENYPKRLKECEDSPLVLYCKGSADLDAGRMLAVVGTRKATWYGKGLCSTIIRELAANPKPPTIVSGLAFGIDAQAHQTALEVGLPTIAVLPTGLDTIYPTAHRNLAKQIVQSGGALVTDFCRKTETSPNQFLRRNRIIAGLSDATLLAESYEHGGGLITTGLANSYNREVFACPGRTTDISFAGCNNQIENNLACLATGARSIERVMGWRCQRRANKKIPELEFGDNPQKKAVLSVLAERSPVRFNVILEQAVDPDGQKFTTQSLSSVLLELELDGRVGVSSGDVYELLY